MNPSILVVDDERAFLESVELRLTLDGYTDLTLVEDPLRVEKLLDSQSFDIALLDIAMPQLSGIEVLKQIKERTPDTECIMVTASDSIPTVIKATKAGAYDYLVKPIVPEQLSHSIHQALEHQRLLRSLRFHQEDPTDHKLDHPEAFGSIITRSPRMLRLLHEAELHAGSEIPILISGETGVGKELLAHAIHQASQRYKGPFVAVNMLALSPTLFESEFFGHAKGAFTGADSERKGYLAQARRGTLFLDEIGDLSLELQGKLLRFLQEGTFTKVGQTTAEEANVRFLAATNLDLGREVREGRFRKDLFYRLQFARLDIPPLRHRKRDIGQLSEKFLEASTRPHAILTEEAEAELIAHDWPGNVRELRGVIEAAANLAESGEILPKHLRIFVDEQSHPENIRVHPLEVGELETLKTVEKQHIIGVYEAVDRRKKQAALVLGISLATLYRRLEEYGVD